jgi:hypothetical protein
VAPETFRRTAPPRRGWQDWPVVSGDAERPPVRFEPLRPASRWRLVAAFVLGPILWLVALVVAAWLINESWAIEVGLLVTIAAFLVALVVLAVLREGRQREERRYADRG